GQSAGLSCRYRSTGQSVEAGAGSLTSFLTERYCLYTVTASEILIGHVHHLPWTLEMAEAEFFENSMLAPLKLSPAGKPLLYFSRTLETFEWAPQAVPLQ
ncbi:MAG: DUF2071 domain-containing protein, partial [Cyanobacteria bacterium]|nr:DUF2071 domain-containing protein [Cyanobacteriota bacterium]